MATIPLTLPVYRPLELDVQKPEYQILQQVYGRQGETALTIRATITDDGEPYDFSGKKLEFCCTRPDGEMVHVTEGISLVSDSTYDCTLPPEATAESGVINLAYFRITKDDDPAFCETTVGFVIMLSKSATFVAKVGPYSDRLNALIAAYEAAIAAANKQTEDQKSAFEEKIKELESQLNEAVEEAKQEAQSTFEQSEATRQTTFENAERERSETFTTAENARQTAEEEREAAEALREKNSKKAVSDAKNAVTQAKKATTSATNAADAATQAAGEATSAAEAANQAAVSVTSTVEDIANKEAERQAAELIRESDEETRESNEAQRIEDHKKHNEQQEANNQAQTANDAAQAQNDLAQQRNNAQQQANNEAALNHQFITLNDGQFDPDSRKPTIEEPLSGPVYRVPKVNPTETDKYDEWYWTVTTDGAGEWEAWTATQIAEAPAIPTDKIDRVVAGEEVSGDEVLKTTQLSYYDKARKTANDALYAKQSDTDDALSGKVTTSDFDDYKKTQSTKDGEQDKAIEAAQINAEKTAADALQKAVEAQETKDNKQDAAIEAAQAAADAAAKRIPPTVTTEAAGIVPPIPEDATEKQYAIHLDEDGNAAWIEVEAKAGSGAADPRALRATIAAATKMHDEAHTDVQDDPLLHSWQNTQEAIEALQRAIDAAKVVSDGFLSEYFLQTELDEANNALLQAIETFKSTGAEAVPNLTEFESLKARVKAVDDETAVSADGKEITFGEKWVTPSERTTAAAAVNTATASIQAATKQSQIDAACDTFETAVTLYEGQVKTAAADNAGIDQALSDAEKAREGVVVSEDGSELEPGSRYVTEQQPLDDIASAIEAATQAKSDATTQQMLDDAASTLNQAIKDFNAQVKQNISIYGVRFDNFPTTKGVRTDGAADFGDVTPAVSNGSGSSPFDDIAPWSEMKAEDRVGGRMVKIPCFWYKLEQNGKGVNVQIATGPMEGFTISPAHMNRNDGKGEREAVYVGRYHCATGTYHSTSKVMPANNDTKANMFTAIGRIGQGYYMMDFATRFTLWLLYLVEMAEWNSQNQIGFGCGNNSSPENMGYTDSMQYCTGTTQSSPTTQAIGTQWRNIEGLWDNVYDFMSGCYNDNSGFCIITDAAKLGDSTGGKSVGTPQASGFVGELKVSNTGGFPMFYGSNTSGGSETAGTCDNWYFASTHPVVFVGGYYNRFANCGMFFVNSTSATDKYASLGCRLLELP